ncbi:bifunctional 4-hydroxy-2-oxoglutarate aldolase/2-dehydro-3-deoxy-phosphogluconate aldolase [Zobellella denitrificans]
MTELHTKLAQLKIIPVIAIDKAEDIIPLGKVLTENGMPCAEITFRTPAAAEAIHLLRQAQTDMLIGAGTVLSPEQADLAVAAGADFVVSPGFNPRVVRHCLDQGIAIIPGVNNPSLAEQAMDMGLSLLKFFPAGPSGGVAMLKAMAAVYPVRFMPTGGVSAANIGDYLALGNVVACGGTWMVPADLIASGDWEGIGALVREAMAGLA